MAWHASAHACGVGYSGRFRLGRLVSDGRSQSDAAVGCIVCSTTASSSAERLSRSTSSVAGYARFLPVLASTALVTVLVAFAFGYWAAFVQTVGSSAYDQDVLEGWRASWLPT
jgi:hypothetical protein